MKRILLNANVHNIEIIGTFSIVRYTVFVVLSHSHLDRSPYATAFLLFDFSLFFIRSFILAAFNLRFLVFAVVVFFSSIFFLWCIDSLISMVLLLLILMIVYLLLLFCFWMEPSATGQRVSSAVNQALSMAEKGRMNKISNKRTKKNVKKITNVCRAVVCEYTQHIVVRCICILVVSTRIQSTMLYWYYLIWWFCCFSLSLYAFSFIWLLVFACDLVVCVLLLLLSMHRMNLC